MVIVHGRSRNGAFASAGGIDRDLRRPLSIEKVFEVCGDNDDLGPVLVVEPLVVAAAQRDQVVVAVKMRNVDEMQAPHLRKVERVASADDVAFVDPKIVAARP
jgi:hypothetical protein